MRVTWIVASDTLVAPDNTRVAPLKTLPPPRLQRQGVPLSALTRAVSFTRFQKSSIDGSEFEVLVSHRTARRCSSISRKRRYTSAIRARGGGTFVNRRVLGRRGIEFGVSFVTFWEFKSRSAGTLERLRFLASGTRCITPTISQRNASNAFTCNCAGGPNSYLNSIVIAGVWMHLNISLPSQFKNS